MNGNLMIMKRENKWQKKNIPKIVYKFWAELKKLKLWMKYKKKIKIKNKQLTRQK